MKHVWGRKANTLLEFLEWKTSMKDTTSET